MTTTHTTPRKASAMTSTLPAHLLPYWGSSTVDPRTRPAYCPAQSVKTPAIPWHNGITRCLSCGTVRVSS